MTIANVSRGNTSGLPDALKIAQEATQLSEVQEVFGRLSEYKFGILIPHMHDEQSGEFQPLPDDVMQVESALGISFQRTEEIANRWIAFFPWDGLAWRFFDNARQRAKWFGRKVQEIQVDSIIITCQNETSAALHGGAALTKRQGQPPEPVGIHKSRFEWRLTLERSRLAK
jgi:hypothetical protein